MSWCVRHRTLLQLKYNWKQCLKTLESNVIEYQNVSLKRLLYKNNNNQLNKQGSNTCVREPIQLYKLHNEKKANNIDT